MNQFFSGVIAVIGLVWVAVAPAMANEETAKQFAVNLADTAVEILENKNLSETGKQSELKELFAASIDFKWVARFVLGKHWRAADDAQKQAYLQAYEQFVINNFTQKLGEYTGQEYEVKQVRADGEPGEYLLTLELKNRNEPSVYLDYRLREKDGKHKIFDIIVEGVSLITTQRSEFGSVVDREGLDYLINALEKKAAAKR